MEEATELCRQQVLEEGMMIARARGKSREELMEQAVICDCSGWQEAMLSIASEIQFFGNEFDVELPAVTRTMVCGSCGRKSERLVYYVVGGFRSRFGLIKLLDVSLVDVDEGSCREAGRCGRGKL